MRPSWEHPHPGEMADSQPCFTSSQIPDKSWPLSWLQQDKDVPSALTEPPCQGREMGQDSHLMRVALTPRDPSPPQRDGHHRNPQDRLTGAMEQTEGGQELRSLGRPSAGQRPSGILVNISQTFPGPQDLAKYTRTHARRPPTAQG